MTTRRVLIVEDEAVQQRLLEGLVSKAGFLVEVIEDGAQAVTRILDTGAPEIYAVLLDLGLPGLSGIEVLERIRPSRPNLPVIVLTAETSQRAVVKAMRAGAQDFMVKPASAERIRTALESVAADAGLTGEIEGLSEEEAAKGMASLIGNSPAMEAAKKNGLKAAASLIPVLIEGESGVGKEVFARAIHMSSSRRNKPFVAVNCGAIPDNLVESTLFGHIKGSFTGATDTRKGKFLEADGGTLFLDEVGELPLDVQPKLLRALQERMIDAVGATNSQQVNIRVISATNRTLADQVAAGNFREDLFYRLNVFQVTLPPLRARLSDVPRLATHFVQSIAKTEDMPEREIPDDMMQLMQGHSWPGNVRQLRNALFRAMVLSEGPVLRAEDLFQNAGQAGALAGALPAALPAALPGALPGAQAASGAGASPLAPSPVTAPPSDADPQTGPGATMLELMKRDGEMKTLATLEAEAIAHALKACDGHLTEVSRQLGIGRSTLYRKLKEYGLESRP